MRYLITLLTLALSSYLSAQTHKGKIIPDSLLKDAGAVILSEESIFTLKDIRSATERVSKEILILNQKGEELSSIEIGEDKFRKLRSFSGEISINGKILKKVGKSDLKFSAYSSEMASDDRTLYYNFKAPSYPYTISINYEIEWRDGIMVFPTFIPAYWSASVLKSVHKIRVPADIPIRVKQNLLTPAPKRELIDKKDSLISWSVENIKAIKDEPLSPSLFKLSPFAYISPAQFIFDGYKGDNSTWESTGKFFYDLMEGKDTLPEKYTGQIMALKGENNIETIKSLYDFLQKNTRYVSIQLGIGGYMPFHPADVAKYGYGDCKALTNYMKTMLKYHGIESVYSIVSTVKRDFFEDFSSITQGNHVVLCIPNERDTIWLECTSKLLPFNYIHQDIAGHNALLVTESGGKLVRIKEEPDSLNKIENSAVIKIDKEGTGNTDIEIRASNHSSEKWIYFSEGYTQQEKIKLISESLKIQSPKIRGISSVYEKRSNPVVTVSIKIDSTKFGDLSGSRLFVSTNIFDNPFERVFNTSSRSYNLEIDQSINRTDHIEIIFPENLTLESIPAPLELSNKFGRIKSSIEVNGNRITISYKINILRGIYPVSDYKEFREFIGKIERALASKIVFKQP